MKPRIAAVLVTQDAVEFLFGTLVSIDGQNVSIDLRLAIDDHSTNGKLHSLQEHGLEIRWTRCRFLGATMRIGLNVLQEPS